MAQDWDKVKEDLSFTPEEQTEITRRTEELKARLPEKLDPDAWADGALEDDLNEREGVQEVDANMVEAYVLAENQLFDDVAPLFADWYMEWIEGRNEEGELTNDQLISDALRHWRGR